MTLIGEVPAARLGDAATVLDEDRVMAFVHDQLAARPFNNLVQTVARHRRPSAG
jgi:hypothetical protein